MADSNSTNPAEPPDSRIKLWHVLVAVAALCGLFSVLVALRMQAAIVLVLVVLLLIAIQVSILALVRYWLSRGD